MATTTVSVSFSNGFVGDATKNNEASNSAYLTSLGWSNFQFVQTTNNGLFGGTQGNDYSGTILITDAANVQHRIDGVINWRAPSGNVSTMVFYATGASHTLATTTGTYFIDPYTETNGDPHSFIGLTFNGQTLAISGGKVTGNAATTGLLDTLNTYLANQPQLTVSDVTVNEDGGYATLTVALSKASTDTVTVKYTTQPGTATAGSDYTATSGSLIFSPGQTTKTVQIAITDDALAEGDETFSLVLSDSSFAAITDNTGVITIRDNDVTQSVTGISVGPAVTEGANLVYTVALNVASPTPVEYTLGRSGTAGASDYGTLILGSGASWKNGDPTNNTIVVAAGTTSFTITAPTVDDTEIENSETLVLTLGGKSAVGIINDNDRQAVAGVTVGPAVTEGGSLVYTVSLSGASAYPVTYTLTKGGTAGASDYGTLILGSGASWKDNDPSQGKIVVAAGTTSFTITAPTVDDTEIENSETLVLTLGGKSAVGIINDNDRQAVAGVTVGPAVTEGGSLVYTVSLSGASAYPVTYTLTKGGTAGASDYGTLILGSGASWKDNDPSQGKIVVAAGTTSFTITAPTVDDTEIENSETLVLTLGGKSAVGTINDNDKVPFGADLDPRTDNGSSNTDKITSIIQPEFTLSGGPLVRGGTVQLVDSQGRVTGTTAITAADVTAGQVNVKTVPLDDGVYTFQARILDASGQVKAQAPVTVTIVTDRDGVMPSVERAAYNGDFNRDGIADWEQNNVAQLPLASISAYLAGKYAPQQSFGAIMAGTVDALHPGTSVQLTSNAQLADLKVTAAPAPLPANTVAATPMLHFTITAQTGLQPLSDMDPTRPGLQTRVVIDLPAGGVKANDFFKWNPVSKTWYSFLDDQRLDTFDNGATLLDLNGDGKIDRVVVTLTDGGPGDEDGLVNGTIVDPGMLVFQNLPPAPPAATPVFSIRMASGDRYYTTSAADAARMAQGTGNVLEGARFDSLEGAGSQHFNAYYQPFTKDWYFAADGQPMPYACYQRADGAGFNAALPGQGSGAAFHLYQNAQGLTQLVTVAEAASLGLAGQGYSDKGVKFSTTTSSAFVFDAEGYLVANRSNASVAALVQTLAGQYHATSEAGFVEAVEQHYLAQVTLVGIPHGSAASAADLNAAFGTHFGV